MSKRFYYLKIPVIIVVLGIAVSWSVEAQTDRRLNGTWVSIFEGIEVEMTMNNGNYEEKNNGIQASRGTYTTVNNIESTTITTHVFGQSWNIIFGFNMFETKWYTINEFIIALRVGLLGLGVPERQINELITPLITPRQATYSVDSNTYILTSTVLGERVVMIFNKK